MARIAGVDIPREKRLEISLTYIFGIGRSTSQVVCQQTGLSPDTRVRDLTEDEVARLRAFIDSNLKIEGDLRREIAGSHQAQDRDRDVPGDPAPPEPAGARPAHADERAHPQGSEAHRRRPQEGPQVVSGHPRSPDTPHQRQHIER